MSKYSLKDKIILLLSTILAAVAAYIILYWTSQAWYLFAPVEPLYIHPFDDPRNKGTRGMK